MLELIKWSIAVLLSGGFFTFLQFLITRKDNKNNKYKELNKKIEEGLEEREETGRKRYEEHKEAIEELREVMLKLAENNKKQNEIINANSKLLVGLTQDRIYYLTEKYIERGCITLDELSMLEEIYEPYHKEPLNGNGKGKAGLEKCRNLPIVSEEIAAMKKQ